LTHLNGIYQGFVEDERTKSGFGLFLFENLDLFAGSFKND